MIFRLNAIAPSLRSPGKTAWCGYVHAAVPLSSIADLETDEVTYEIRRDNLRNMSAVTGRLSGRDLGTTVDEIKHRLYKEVNIPPGTDIEFGGQYLIQQESFQGLTMVLLMSMLLRYTHMK